MTHERVSVIVPTLNEAATLARTLAGLQEMRRAGAVELIVVDGGSRDATVQVAVPYADRVLVAPRGRARQMNAGAETAGGAILLFLHADTRLPEGWLAAIRDALGGPPRWGRFDVSIDGDAAVLAAVATMMNLRSRLTGLATGDQAIFVERALFEQAGRFPDIALMEDIALSRALKRLAGRPACLRLRACTSGRRWEREGVWRTIALMWRLRLLYFLGVPAERLARAYRSPSSGSARRNAGER
jgi:rSAM/selenodomain-associated transferase 2